MPTAKKKRTRCFAQKRSSHHRRWLLAPPSPERWPPGSSSKSTVYSTIYQYKHIHLLSVYVYIDISYYLSMCTYNTCIIQYILFVSINIYMCVNLIMHIYVYIYSFIMLHIVVLHTCVCVRVSGLCIQWTITRLINYTYSIIYWYIIYTLHVYMPGYAWICQDWSKGTCLAESQHLYNMWE